MQQKNQPAAEIITTADGKGRRVLAKQAFAPGELIISAKALSTHPQRSTHTIQTNLETHVFMDEPAILLNHSCDPNMVIKDNDQGAYDFLARRAIAAGEELSFDYETTELYSTAVPFCLCGAKKCRGKTEGFAPRAGQVLEVYGDNVAAYLRKWYGRY